MSIMMREISEQPEVLERTLRAEKAHVLRVAARLRKSDIRLIVLVARGTSDNAALFGRYLLEMTSGVPVSMSAPSIYTVQHRRLNLRNALVIGVSQSGEGPDINMVLESARKGGAQVLAVTNHGRSTMARIAQDTFVTRAGREKSVAATKTYTCQLMIFHMLAAALSDEGFEKLHRIPDYAEGALGLREEMQSLVERYRFMDRCVVVGRGLNYASAYEMALKLMETCYVAAERFSSADFLHGPIAVVQQDFPVILFAPPGPAFSEMKGLAKKLKENQVDSLIISSEQGILRYAGRAIKIPERVPELYSPIPYIIPGQIFAAMLAGLKGLSPDRPRGLKKVTKTL
jgi:glucosamine--fructose-6-phosphate aminotransferase (isomerizing)